MLLETDVWRTGWDPSVLDVTRIDGYTLQQKRRNWVMHLWRCEVVWRWTLCLCHAAVGSSSGRHAEWAAGSGLSAAAADWRPAAAPGLKGMTSTQLDAYWFCAAISPTAGRFPNVFLQTFLLLFCLNSRAAVDSRHVCVFLQEEQLRNLKLQDQRLQHQELSEQERLQQLRENARNQEAKLRRVRALRGQVEQKRLSNSKLGQEVMQLVSF